MARKPGFHVGMVVIVLMFLITACSGGSDPVTGSFTGGDQELTSPRSAETVNPRLLWGYWTVEIDTETGTVDLVPRRGVMMHVNAVEWMQPPAGSLSNLQVTIIDDSLFVTEGRIDLNVTLTHPFAGLDNFTGFDVMGVFMTDGHQYLLSQLGVTLSDGGNLDATMVNADGYSRWWNQDEFEYTGIGPRILYYIPGKLAINGDGLDAKLNPYKYFTDGLADQDEEGPYLAANAAMRGMFAAGASNTRRYELKFAMPGGVTKLAFDYAVVASWEASPVEPPIVVPDDFPVEANALEPVALSVTDNSDLYYDDDAAMWGGNLNLDLEVYGWQYLAGPGIPDTIDRLTVEFLNGPAFPGGLSQSWTSSSWSVIDGAVNSSIWHVEITTMSPQASGPQPVLVVLETFYNYDNGFGTGYPHGAALSAYFMVDVPIAPNAPGTDDPPYCDPPVPEYADRNVFDLEEFTAVTGEPESEPYLIDWSVVPDGNARQWTNINDDTIVVNWWNATTNGGSTLPPVTGDYEVCVSVYNGDGGEVCCTVVPVDAGPTLEPVTGQNQVILVPQPDQGAETCDLTVSNTGSSSSGEILVQDGTASEVRLYKFNDAYTLNTDITTLNFSWLPAPMNDPFDPGGSWNDFRRFDATQNSLMIHVTSGSDVWPTLVDPGGTGYTFNDPYHSWVLPFYNATGNMNYVAYFGDAGQSGNPDPDARAWKHLSDWSSGVSGLVNTQIYGLFGVSELWLPNHPSENHTGYIYTAWSKSPFFDPTTDLDSLGLQLSTQYIPDPGDIDDTDPGLMALGVDDENYYDIDWIYGPDVWLNDVTVWYMLSSEAAASDRKVHLVLLPEDYDDPNWNDPNAVFYTMGWIGTGSGGWSLDFGGAVPVDVEVMYTAASGSTLDHRHNWLVVLSDTGPGWRVDVYRFEPFFPTLVLVDSHTDDTSFAGTPEGLDVDVVEHEIHVLHLDSYGDHRVTVLDFYP